MRVRAKFHNGSQVKGSAKGGEGEQSRGPVAGTYKGREDEQSRAEQSSARWEKGSSLCENFIFSKRKKFVRIFENLLSKLVG